MVDVLSNLAEGLKFLLVLVDKNFTIILKVVCLLTIIFLAAYLSRKGTAKTELV